jgi:hypothetical protein
MASDQGEYDRYSGAMAGGDRNAESGDATFATWLRQARIDASWTKTDAIAAVSEVGIKERTYNHWEAGSIEKPNPREVRRACLRLGLDPREAAVALGIVTRDDLELGPPIPPPPAVVRNILAVLKMDKLEEKQKANFVRHIEAAMNLWAETLGVDLPVREPSAAERAGRKPAKR